MKMIMKMDGIDTAKVGLNTDKNILKVESDSV